MATTNLQEKLVNEALSWQPRVYLKPGAKREKGIISIIGEQLVLVISCVPSSLGTTCKHIYLVDQRWNSSRLPWIKVARLCVLHFA